MFGVVGGLRYIWAWSSSRAPLRLSSRTELPFLHLALLFSAQRPTLRVVLMSATINAEAFANYFGENVKILHVEGDIGIVPSLEKTTCPRL